MKSEILLLFLEEGTSLTEAKEQRSAGFSLSSGGFLEQEAASLPSGWSLAMASAGIVFFFILRFNLLLLGFLEDPESLVHIF